MKRNYKGFTLVEMSIVLVVIGLLAGGIMGGKSLIRAAELKSITDDVDRYGKVILIFKDQYSELPGDMSNATNVWGSAGGTGADSACLAAQTAGSIATCSGDGNGNANGVGGIIHSERFTAWKHLANAKLIEGTYTGRSTGAIGTFLIVPGTNAPATKAGIDGVFDFSSIDGTGGYYFTGGSFPNDYITLYGLSANNWGFLSPVEASRIDSKFDDGRPATGRIITTKRTSIIAPNCTTSDLDTAGYDLTSISKFCLLMFRVN